MQDDSEKTNKEAHLEKMNELKNQIIDSHGKRIHKEIDYDVVQRFGGDEGNTDKSLSEKNTNATKLQDDGEDPQEIRYETINKFGQAFNEMDDKEMEGNDYENKERESEENLNHDESEILQSKTKKKNSALHVKGKKNIDAHLLESHLEKQTSQDRSMTNELYTPVTVLKHMEVNTKKTKKSPSNSYNSGL